MDASCASGTGIFDPFTMQWADWGINILKLPRNIFPEVVDTVGDFGVTPVDLFGAEIPICCSVSREVSSLCEEPPKLRVELSKFLGAKSDSIFTQGDNENTANRKHKSKCFTQD